jgi:hypothetical protein
MLTARLDAIRIHPYKRLVSWRIAFAWLSRVLAFRPWLPEDDVSFGVRYGQIRGESLWLGGFVDAPFSMEQAIEVILPPKRWASEGRIQLFSKFCFYYLRFLPVWLPRLVADHALNFSTSILCASAAFLVLVSPLFLIRHPLLHSFEDESGVSIAIPA